MQQEIQRYGLLMCSLHREPPSALKSTVLAAHSLPIDFKKVNYEHFYHAARDVNVLKLILETLTDWQPLSLLFNFILLRQGFKSVFRVGLLHCLIDIDVMIYLLENKHKFSVSTEVVHFYWEKPHFELLLDLLTPEGYQKLSTEYVFGLFLEDKQEAQLILEERKALDKKCQEYLVGNRAKFEHLKLIYSLPGITIDLEKLIKEKRIRNINALLALGKFDHNLKESLWERIKNHQQKLWEYPYLVDFYAPRCARISILEQRNYSEATLNKLFVCDWFPVQNLQLSRPLLYARYCLLISMVELPESRGYILSFLRKL